jgi:hypothetical protein
MLRPCNPMYESPDADDVAGPSEVPPPHDCENVDDATPIHDLDELVRFLP